MNKIKVILLVIVLLASRAYSQGATATVGTVTACPADTILVPFNVTNFSSISAMTLFITYNASVLSFQGLINVNSSLSGVSSNAMTSPFDQIGIAWSNINPFTVISGKLFDLKFVLTGGTCNLSITNQSEIVNSSLDIISFTRYNGSVNQNSTPVFSLQPQSANIKSGDDASFSVSATGVSSYQWLVSSDGGNSWTNVLNFSPYSGANSTVLHISVVTPGLNNKKFRCKANGICSAYSSVATLTVDTVTGIVGTVVDEIAKLSIYPNPCNEYTCIEYTIADEGDIKIEVYNSLGQVVQNLEYKNIPAGNNKILTDCSHLYEGIYFYRIEIKNTNDYFSQTKMITIAR